MKVITTTTTTQVTVKTTPSSASRKRAREEHDVDAKAGAPPAKMQRLDKRIDQMTNDELKDNIRRFVPDMSLSHKKKDVLIGILEKLLQKRVDEMKGPEVANELKNRGEYKGRSTWNKTELSAWLKHLRCCLADDKDKNMYQNAYDKVVSLEEFKAMPLFEIHMRYDDRYGFKLSQTKRKAMYAVLEEVWRADKAKKEQEEAKQKSTRDEPEAVSSRKDVIRELEGFCAYKGRSSWSVKELKTYLDHIRLKGKDSVWQKDVNKAMSREQFLALPLFRINELYGFSKSETSKKKMYDQLCKRWEDDEKEKKGKRMQLVKPIVEAFLVQTGDDAYCVKQKAVSLKPAMNLLFLAELDESEYKSVCAFCRDNGLSAQTFRHRTLGKTVCVSRKDDEAHALAIIDRS